MTPDDQIEAAELALGLLEGGDRAAALERMLADTDFAMEVAWWREKLAALIAGYDAVVPPADVLARIELADHRPAGTPVAKVRPRGPWVAGGTAAGARCVAALGVLASAGALAASSWGTAAASFEAGATASAAAPARTGK